MLRRFNRLARGSIAKRVRRGLTVEGWIGIGRGDIRRWCDRRSSGVCLCRRRGVGFRLLGRGGSARRCRVSRGLLGRGGIRLSLGGSCRLGLGLCRGISLSLRRRGGIGFGLVAAGWSASVCAAAAASASACAMPPPRQRLARRQPRPRQSRLAGLATYRRAPAPAASIPTTVPVARANASAQRNQTRGAFVGSDMCTSSPSTMSLSLPDFPATQLLSRGVVPLVGISLAPSDARRVKPVSPPMVRCAREPMYDWRRDCTVTQDRRQMWSDT